MSKPKAAISSGYVDLATFTGINTGLYGGDKVLTPFVRRIKKSSWFTNVLASLGTQGQADSPEWNLSKSGDFLLNALYEFDLPKITVKSENNGQLTYRVAWTWNLGHNLLQSESLTFNDLSAQSMDSVMRDMLSEFRVSQGKWSGYQEMIGNKTSLQTFASVLPADTIQVPSLLSFSRDPTVAVPLCCAQFNDIKLKASCEVDIRKLLRVQKNMAADVVNDAADWQDVKPSSLDLASLLTIEGIDGMTLRIPRALGEYAMVTKEERNNHKSNRYDMIFEQCSKASSPSEKVGDKVLQLNFTTPVKALFFGFKNKTSDEYNNLSNYTDSYKTGVAGKNPLDKATLRYDEQPRFENFPPRMFKALAYFHAKRTPTQEGFQMLPYCNDLNSLIPDGSTDFGSVSPNLEATSSETSGENNKYQLVARALTYHVGRFELNTFGFPSF